MRKHLPKRILSFVLATLIIASEVIPAFAAKRADVYNWGNMAEYSFAYASHLNSAYPNGACTGLAWEETDVKPKTGYTELGGAFWYGKHWASAKSPTSAAISLKGEDSTKINVEFSKIANTFLTCIKPHTADSGDKASAPRGAQLFANYVYLPTENNNNYPDYIKDRYSDMTQLKFYYYLFALLQSCPDAPPTAGTLDDAVADTYKSMLAFAYSRCLEDGALSGGPNSNPDTDWNIVRSHLEGMLAPGVPTAWSQMCSAGQTDFKKYWERAAFLSSLTAAYDGAGGVNVLMPLSEASQGSDGKWHMTLDYSGMSEYAKKYLQKVTSSGSGKLSFTNNGSSIDVSAASQEDITDATELGSVIMSCPDFPEAPVLCVELQPIGIVLGTYGTTNQTDICGQQRFAVTYMPLNIKITAGGSTPPPPGEVVRYEHTETFTATYNIDIHKHDSETGQGLKGAEYKVTHTHDNALLDDENWDENTISDDCEISGASTDTNGIITGLSDGKQGHTDVRTYSYHKGYCGGHHIPDFVEIPEEEEDEDGNVTNEGEIEAAKAENDELIQKYFEDIVLCCQMEEEGGFFCKSDDAGYSSSSTPTTGCDSKEEYESQCQEIAEAKDELEEDRDEKYSEFISITYTYEVEETKAKAGYSLHGVHVDDIPIETKRVWSSEYMDGAVRTSANFENDTIMPVPSFFDKAFGVMTAYAAEMPEDKAIEEEIAAETESVQKETEPESESIYEEGDVSEASPSTGDYEDGDILNDIDTASMSEAELASISELETEEIDSILDVISNIWQALLDFVKGTADKAEEIALEVKGGLKKLLKAPLKGMLFGAGGGDTSGGTVGTQGMSSWQPSEVSEVDPADDSIVNHTWIIYDHRTEGEIHLNKRDLNLAKGEDADYDSYADANGDGTLEGAVYGLFAAQNIVHPDGHTGVVYYKDEITAIATTDRNGDISFTAYTEAPGYIYKYETGSLVKDPAHASFTGPMNMHRTMGANETKLGTKDYVGHTSGGSSVSIDNYASGGADYYKKVSSNQSHIEGITRNGTGNYTYPVYNNELNNGNCWIGRPLIVGESSATKVSPPEEQTIALAPKTLVHNTYPTSAKILEKIALESGSDNEKLVGGLNEAFSANGFTAPSSEAPWIKVSFTGSTMAQKVADVLTALNDNAASYATRLLFEEHSGSVYVRYDHYDKTAGALTDSFCDITTGTVYLRMDSGKGYFVYIPFEESDAVPGSWVSTSSGGYTYVTSGLIYESEIDSGIMPAMYGTIDIPSIKSSLIGVPAKSHWLYDGVMPEFNDDGTIRKENRTRTITSDDPEWGDPSYENILWEYIDDPIETETCINLVILNKDGSAITSSDADAYTAQSVSFISKNTGSAARYKVKVELNGKTFTNERLVPSIKNKSLTVFNELTGSGKDIYKDEESEFTIRLYYRPTGEELTGSYAYDGSRTGYMKSGDTIALKGNEFITVNSGVYEDVDYEVVRKENGRTVTAANASGNFRDERGAGALFTRSVKNTAEREIFKTGESYDLIETTAYTDGKNVTTNRIRLTIDPDGRVSKVTAFDKDTKVLIEKLTPDGTVLEDCEMEVYDNVGNLVDSFTSGSGAYDITAKLLADGRYRLVEKKPADGYTWADEITFTVSHDGKIDYVVMMDDRTNIEIHKYKKDTTDRIGGAVLQIIASATGTVVAEWTTVKDEVKIFDGVLAADTDYILHEKVAPPGYKLADDIPFHVGKDVTTVKVEMYDELKPYSPPPTPGTSHHLVIHKVDADGNPLPGAKIKVTQAGTDIPRAVSVNAEGTEFRFEVFEGESLEIQEIEFPDGIRNDDTIYKIKIKSDGSAEFEEEYENLFTADGKKFDLILVNWKAIMGKITAEYDAEIYGFGKGYFDSEGRWHPWTFNFMGKMGDDFPLGMLLIIFAVCVAGAFAFAIARKKAKEKEAEENEK